jgi:hypothetical protein
VSHEACRFRPTGRAAVRADSVAMPEDEVLAALRTVRLRHVRSRGVRMIGYDPVHRMAAVVYPDRETVYGYPGLSDEEIRGLVDVMEHDESLGAYISTIIKKNHDHERVVWERVAS